MSPRRRTSVVRPDDPPHALTGWAVTKGPSLDPAVRRMAVQVESHPLARASVDAAVPVRQYSGQGDRPGCRYEAAGATARASP